MTRSRTVRLSLSLYPRPALLHATEAFRELCDLKEEADAERSAILVTINPREGAPDETIDEFLSYLLSAALELHLSESA